MLVLHILNKLVDLTFDIEYTEVQATTITVVCDGAELSEPLIPRNAIVNHSLDERITYGAQIRAAQKRNPTSLEREIRASNRQTRYGYELRWASARTPKSTLSARSVSWKEFSPLFLSTVGTKSLNDTKAMLLMMPKQASQSCFKVK